MKKIHILISLGAVMAAAAGCTKTTVRGDIPDNGEQVPVVLNAEIPSAEATVSKSPITASSRFTATVGGWVSRTGSADYTGTPSWTAVTSEIAGNADRQPVTLTEQPYYEPDDADKTYMKAWYPEGTPSGGSVSFENTDGSVDAMMSREIVGSRKDKDGKNLVFDHLTAQLIFDVVGGEGLDAGTTITSIKVLEAGLPTGFDLAAGTATFTPAADGGLTVPGIDGTQVIGSTAAQAGLPVLITDNHKPYKQRKVRILNGAHTSMVLGAYLAGQDIVRDCMHDDIILNFMNKTIYDEIIPTLSLSKEDCMDFAAAVTERFKNPFIDHALLSISLNSTSKWRARVMPSLEGYVEKFHRLPQCITASFAFYIQFYHLGRELTDAGLVAVRPNGDSYVISDDRSVLEFYYQHKDCSIKDLVHAVCTNTDFWGKDLTLIPGFEENVVSILEDIQAGGTYEEMKKCL